MLILIMNILSQCWELHPSCAAHEAAERLPPALHYVSIIAHLLQWCLFCAKMKGGANKWEIV